MTRIIRGIYERVHRGLVESPQTYKHAIGKAFPCFSDFCFATTHTETTTITLQTQISIPQKISLNTTSLPLATKRRTNKTEKV